MFAFLWKLCGNCLKGEQLVGTLLKGLGFRACEAAVLRKAHGLVFRCRACEAPAPEADPNETPQGVPA